MNGTPTRVLHNATIYIAGKMNGVENFNFPRFFMKEKELKDMGFKVINPAKIGVLPEYEMYYPINCAMLDGCDAIYLMDGWQDSPGSVKELEYAASIGIKAIVEEEPATLKLISCPVGEQKPVFQIQDAIAVWEEYQGELDAMATGV